MAKGDKVSVLINTGDGSVIREMVASKAGRKVRVVRGTRWTTVVELTRTDRPTGNQLQVQTSAILGITESVIEP